jgi:hypothetical protein
MIVIHQWSEKCNMHQGMSQKLPLLREGLRLSTWTIVKTAV